jgi:hypothetical protein
VVFKHLNENGVCGRSYYTTNVYQKNLYLELTKLTNFLKVSMQVKYELCKRGDFFHWSRGKHLVLEDNGLGDTPLAHNYPVLYNIAQQE